MVRGNIGGLEKAGKSKKIRSSLEPADTLNLAWWDPCKSSDLQDFKVINVYFNVCGELLEQQQEADIQELSILKKKTHKNFSKMNNIYNHIYMYL